MKKEQGFSSVEMLMSAGITLVLLAGAMSAFNSGLGLHQKATQMADLEQNLRAGMNLLARDFISAGWNIPIGGLPIPSGTGADPVIRPGPPDSNYTFGAVNIAAVNPGEGLGPVGFGQSTDMVNILFADSTLDDMPLDAIAVNGSDATVNNVTTISGIRNAVREGDLIAFSNANGNALQYVTNVINQQIFFHSDDPMNLNQPNAEQGSITSIRNEGLNTYPPTTARRVVLITYFVDYSVAASPRLVRQVNNRDGDVVGLVIDNLRLTYDLVDGVGNPTDIGTPVAPNSPNQIRKANLFLSGRSSLTVQESGEYLRRNLETQVSLRSLSFIDRYR